MKRNQRGIAIITVVLVLLLLTVLGLTASMMMTQEDTTSSRMDLQRQALYIAEAGLRRGERVLGGINYSNTVLTAMLNRSTSTATYAVQPHVPLRPSSNKDYRIDKLGTYLTTVPSGGVELANQPLIEGSTNVGSGRQAFYSLYIRNNPEDTSPTVNSDTKIRLISVGWIAQDVDAWTASRNPLRSVLAVKILEEEYNWAGVTQSPSAQKQTNQGGTGQGIYGG